jgi:PIN domain nuclease of toxin-antitoxin system
VDKTKLDGLTNYTHPSTHPAAIIVQDSSNRFVTDAQINSWNAKASTEVVTDTANGLMSFDDKIKLDGFTNYTHPSTHVPSIIVQDSSNRFVTDTQIAYWNAKAENTVVTLTSNGLMTPEDKTKLDGIADGATAYVHPANHAPAIITQDSSNRFVTDTQITYWNAKSPSDVVTTTVNGLMLAADKVKLDELTNYTHPLTHVPSIIVQDSSNRFVTDTQIAYWNAKAPSDVVTTTVNGLMTAADKVKLDGIEDGATNYVHPVNHPATILTTDPTHRLVTDEQIIAWNAAIKPVATVLTANTTLSALSGKYLVDASAGPIVITLLTADASKGSEIFIKKIDSSSNTVSVVADTTLPDLIDGMPSQILDGQYQSILISSSTTSWYIM